MGAMRPPSRLSRTWGAASKLRFEVNRKERFFALFCLKGRNSYPKARQSCRRRLQDFVVLAQSFRLLTAERAKSPFLYLR